MAGATTLDDTLEKVMEMRQRPTLQGLVDSSGIPEWLALSEQEDTSPAYLAAIDAFVHERAMPSSFDGRPPLSATVPLPEESNVPYLVPGISDLTASLVSLYSKDAFPHFVTVLKSLYEEDPSHKDMLLTKANAIAGSVAGSYREGDFPAFSTIFSMMEYVLPAEKPGYLHQMHKLVEDGKLYPSFVPYVVGEVLSRLVEKYDGLVSSVSEVNGNVHDPARRDLETFFSKAQGMLSRYEGAQEIAPELVRSGKQAKSVTYEDFFPKRTFSAEDIVSALRTHRERGNGTLSHFVERYGPCLGVSMTGPGGYKDVTLRTFWTNPDTPSVPYAVKLFFPEFTRKDAQLVTPLLEEGSTLAGIEKTYANETGKVKRFLQRRIGERYDTL